MTYRHRLPAVVVAAFLAGLVGACQTASDLQDAFVGGGGTPDEDFGASSGPKLTLPPDYNLRPPVGGGGAGDGDVAAQVARKRVFNIAPEQEAAVASPGGVPGRPSPGEVFLLQRAGISAVNPNIREEVEVETTVIDESDAVMVEKLLKWQNTAPEEEEVVTSADGTVVEEEAADDIPPVIIRKRRGLLESIF